MRTLLFLLALTWSAVVAGASPAATKAVTIPAGTYSVTFPSAVTFTPNAAPPCAWPPAPSVPFCSDGVTPSGSYVHGACPAWVFVATTCPPVPPPTGALISGMTDVTPEALLPRPTRVVSQTEPHWRSTINVAAVLAELPADPHGTHPSWIRTDYSRHEAFNADSSSYFLTVSTGYWALFDARTRTFTKWIANLAGDAEPQWDATDPNKLFYLAINGTSRQLYSQDVRTGTQVVEGNLGPAMDAIPECVGTTAAYTKAEGSPSKDMRFWSFIGASGNNFDSKCLIVWDNRAKSIVWHMPTGGDNPDHISMMPDGRFVVPSWDSSKGTVAYRVDGAGCARVHHKSEHSDLFTFANGHAGYVSIDYQSNAGDVFFVDLDSVTLSNPCAPTADAVRTVLYPTYYNPLTRQGGATGSFHFSGKAYARPGYVFIGTYGDGADRSTPPTHQWFSKRLEAWNLNVSPPINYSIATQHTADGGGYEAETHMSSNKDGTKVLFNSNWGTPTDAGVQPFEIDIPASAIP